MCLFDFIDVPSISLQFIDPARCSCLQWARDHPSLCAEFLGRDVLAAIGQGTPVGLRRPVLVEGDPTVSSIIAGKIL
jgi:hypothetical protein